MNIYKMTSGMLGVNSYFIVTEKNEAIVIDCGENYEAINDFAREKGFTVKVALLTHYHFDHTLCCKRLQEDGVKIVISEIDAKMLEKGYYYPHAYKKTGKEVVADKTFTDGEILDLLEVKIKAIITAGHSLGSACFILEDNIFSGDTLFQLSYGRTDFIDGDFTMLKKSLEKLFLLEGEYKVFPGHGEATSLNFERKNNAINYDYD